MAGAFVNFSSQIENPHFENVFDVEPKELFMNKSKVVMIDVRQPDEFTGELGHVEGSELIVLDTLPENMNKLPKDKTIVFICRSGGRSARATAFAKECGYQSVYNMLGGMLLWNELNLPTTKG